MCSWCYGFEPELQQLRETWGSHAQFHLLVGGLRRETKPIGDRMRSFLRSHWDEVKERTGRPFKYDILSTDLIYDTEPACRATVAAGITGESRLGGEVEFEYFRKAQQAFYYDNKNPQDIDTWVSTAIDTGLSADRFTAVFLDHATHERTRKQFAQAQQMGVTGFPSVLAECNDKRTYITLGYTTYSVLHKRLQQFCERHNYRPTAP